jgi:hypothetical protein
MINIHQPEKKKKITLRIVNKQKKTYFYLFYMSVRQGVK